MTNELHFPFFQQDLNLLPTIWSPFPTAQLCSYNQAIDAPLSDPLSDFCDQFNDLRIFRNEKSAKSPPLNYMCHLCFKKGHYIRDCPQVSVEEYLKKNLFISN